MIRDTNPFRDGMIEEIFYCDGRTYKTKKGAIRNNPGKRVYLVHMTYEPLMGLDDPTNTECRLAGGQWA